MSMYSDAFTVSSLNAYIKSRFDSDEILQSVFVKGEISNYKYHSSGHHYFSIKDSECSLRCVLFKNNAFGLRFRPENGLKVILFGRVSVYTRDGSYQFYCQKMIPDGAGDLQIAYEQLKNRLNEEGLFDSRHKKALPDYPGRIAVITSGTGAVVHDVINILKKRWPLASVLVVPVRVQGQGAASDIASAIQYVNQYSLADLIITGRGGGTIEDLWAFNMEEVCRAIFSSDIPVISAVGHEPDTTLSDYAADLRASTPSNAAELAVPDKDEMLERLEDVRSRYFIYTGKKLSECRHDIDRVSRQTVFSDPETLYQDYRQNLDHLYDAMISHMSAVINEKKNLVSVADGRMKALNPKGVLARGYSVALKNGEAVSSLAQLQEKDIISLLLCDGTAECEVKKINHPER